jgi:hypothetical protein
MEAILGLVLIILGLIAFDGAALSFGSDSRDALGDDRLRPSHS